MRVALDVMGGDHAPQEIVRGAAEGLKHLGPSDSLVLYGPQDLIEAQCKEHGVSDDRIEIEHCEEAIGMDESPIEAIRQKRKSTIVRMAADAGKNKTDAVISAGNTGAFVAACQLRIRPIPGVSRPGIAVIMPTFHGPVVICDVGANVAPKSRHLYEYARMASIYARTLLGAEKARVGMLSVGEEEGKGNTLVKEAAALCRKDPELDYIGNVEGRYIFAAEAEVFVCDGFVGNIILKLTEGLAEGLFRTIVSEIKEEDPALAEKFSPIVSRIWKRHDFAEYGGAPLLGLSTLAIICHGRSDSRAIANAIRVAVEQENADLNGIIAKELATIAAESE